MFSYVKYRQERLHAFHKLCNKVVVDSVWEKFGDVIIKFRHKT